MSYASLQFGQGAPWFAARSPSNADFHFDTVAGRFIVICFFESAGDASMRQLLDGILKYRAAFDDANIAFFGVSTDGEDESSKRVVEQLPGIHLFWDFDRKISRLFGAAPLETAGSDEPYRRMTVVLDPRLRAVAVFPIEQNIEDHLARLMGFLRTIPRIDALPAEESHAPVLIVPRVFEPSLCQALIKFLDERGSKESGFIREVDGNAVRVSNYGFKRRRDRPIDDENLLAACRQRIQTRLMPEIYKAFGFKTSNAAGLERYVVACYDADTGGHFKPHRDNTASALASRRFAVSLVLNSGQFEGGQLRFPEFGSRAYAPPLGGAAVFSCSLLHEAMPVTRGKRYVFLLFLFDDAAAPPRGQAPAPRPAGD